MTVSQWMNKQGKLYGGYDVVIHDENNNIILDDRLAYLSLRSKEYNNDWKSKCRGKHIANIETNGKSVYLLIK